MPNSSDKVDILENHIPREFLEILLADRTTGNNILWATDIGGHKEQDCIQLEDIVGDNGLVVRPRVRKSDEERRERTKKRAEVFTPSWVCNEQLNAADSLWFFGAASPAHGSPFNTPVAGERWNVTEDDALRKAFEETGKSWEQYVLDDRIEMCCGEGPYLTSRYDVVTEREIPVCERIGILDRKLRVVNAYAGLESGLAKREWAEWMIKAYQHTFGFEWQGDSLLLAREAMLYTFIDHLKNYNLARAVEQMGRKKDVWLPIIEKMDFDGLNVEDYEYIRTVCDVISWNLWQMDGLTFCPPYTQPEMDVHKVVKGINHSMVGDAFNHEATTRIPSAYCRLMDWNENRTTTYVEVYASALKKKNHERKH